MFIFSWKEKQLFTRQVRVQIGKSNSNMLTTIEKQSSLAGNVHLSILFFPHRPRTVQLRQIMDGPNTSDKDNKVPVPSAQQKYSTNKKQRVFPWMEKKIKSLEKIILTRVKILCLKEHTSLLRFFETEVGLELGVFEFLSFFFLQRYPSFLLDRSETVTYSFVEPPFSSAAEWTEWVKMELFSKWTKNRAS